MGVRVTGAAGEKRDTALAGHRVAFDAAMASDLA